MEEYDAAIGKGKRTFIPDEHCGFIGYGLEEQREDNHELKYWHAMIIGPQEVASFLSIGVASVLRSC